MERCKCGRPTRIIIFGEPEKAEFDSDGEEGFCIFRKSKPHPDGMCEYCFNNGYEHLNIGKMGRFIYTGLTDHLEEAKHDFIMSIGRQYEHA